MDKIKSDNGRQSDAFSFAAYQSTYENPHRQVRKPAHGNENNLNAARRKIYRDAIRRMKNGVPVDVLIRDALFKLRLVRAGREVI